jgi:LDH2 family malate/lactate/ureidoglycolate dehydrogenase
MDDEVRLSVDEATTLAERSLASLGFEPEQRSAIAAHLVDAELCGVRYAGLARILTVAEDARTRQPRKPVETVHETPASAMLDGGNNVGYYAVRRAADVAIDKARAAGMAIVGVHNTYLSGRNSYYMERIARAGFVALMAASSPPMVAPHGGKRPAFGTNPISFGFPREGDPFIVDLGTASIMRGDAILRSRTGESLPEGVALDSSGNATTDPRALLDGGAILAFGGHRGSALSFAIQTLCLLAGTARARRNVQDFGFLFVVIDPAVLMPREEFSAEVEALIEAIRAVPAVDAANPVRIPSERAFRERSRRRATGFAVDRIVHEKLQAMIAVS